jgi:exonuclease-1
MGIQGLLPLLKSIHINTNISKFSGKTYVSLGCRGLILMRVCLPSLAVDGYVWLHRGAYACALQLVKGQYTTKYVSKLPEFSIADHNSRYVDYAMHRVRMMQHHGITPYMVFDGGPLPAKRGTEKDREEWV